MNSLPQIKCFFLVPAAAFFVTYESTKSLFTGYSATNLAPFTHMLAASLGEIVGVLLFFFLSCCYVLFIYHHLFIHRSPNEQCVCLTDKYAESLECGFCWLFFALG